MKVGEAKLNGQFWASVTHDVVEEMNANSLGKGAILSIETVNENVLGEFMCVRF